MLKHTPQHRSRVTLFVPGQPPIRLDFRRSRRGRPLQMRVDCPRAVGIRTEVMSEHAFHFHVIDNRPKKEPSPCT